MRSSMMMSKFLPSWRLAAIMAAPAAIVAVGLLCAPSARAQKGFKDDYPTEARANYVFGCMAVNGQTQLALHRCSCSIDVIASILPYKRYIDAQTVLSMRQGIGRPANTFRGVGVYHDMVVRLRRAQAEAEVLCFE